jgi:hypothetical protein
MIHRIDLQAPKKGYGKTLLRYNGKDIGASNSPIFAAARWLLDNNAAFDDDTVETYRGNTLCMSGKAGEIGQMDGARERSRQSFTAISLLEAISHRRGTP